MKRLLVVMCLLLPGLVFADAEPKICPHNTFHCLVNNLDDFYNASYNRFFKVYNHAFQQAMQCKNDKAVARFLSIHSAPHDSAEVDEHLQQDTEALLLLKPKCFFNGALLLTAEQQANLVGSYHIFSRPNHVMAVLKQYMKKAKYKKLASGIYNQNLEAYDSYGKAEQDAPMSDLREKYRKYLK
ncbi:MAG: hypothetical protein P8Z75_11655 [Gammaproteobacteria bacterium]|jgi:hypothetical protein